ncbi:MAG: oxidoreductase [Acidobacteriia bacterium]|nr:oxidoreductase [Terriglobia bacterium]
MRILPLLFLIATAVAQSGPRVQTSHTTENLRGVSAVSRQVAWASGTHGTYLRTTDGGQTWIPGQVPDATTLDFRAVVAFSANEAFLMSAGPGDQSRIYHTSDGGQHWQQQFTNSNPKGFFDSMAFWDPKHGIVLGDPIPDEKGKPKFELLATEDGESWHAIPHSQLPDALDGEGAFAASNSCIALGEERHFSAASASEKEGASAPDANIWFATGGKAARVFHSPDRGKTWEAFNTPILHGPESAGIFSIAFRDARHGVIAGGDYKHPDDDGPNLAFTNDGGKTWTLSNLHPQAYFSALAYDQQVNAAALRQSEEQPAKGIEKKLTKPVAPQRLFVVGEDFIFDFRPPNDPRRINGKKKQGFAFNAVSPFPEGGALIVGPKGTIADIP